MILFFQESWEPQMQSKHEKTLQSEYEGDVNVKAIIQSLRRELENMKIEENKAVDKFSNMNLRLLIKWRVVVRILVIEEL